jgi:hypothetical protein
MDASLALEAKKPNFLQKLFVWSLVLEPLGLFIIGDRYLLGIDIRIGRLLQLIFLALFVSDILVKQRRLNISNPLIKENIFFTIFLIFSLISYCFGLATGAYNIERAGVYVGSFLSSATVRPIIEFFILFYWFAYYVVLPRYVLKTFRSVQYLFKAFSVLFFACIWLGLIDLIITILGFDFIPRHLSDLGNFASGDSSPGFVPSRFHGLAGEPRDAIVYMGLGISMLVMRDIFFQKKDFTTPKLLLILFCIALTQSLSGMLGVLMGIGLIGLYFTFYQPSVRRFSSLFLLAMVLVGASYLIYLSSPRIQFYYLIISQLYEVLSGLETIPSYAGVSIGGQMQNIYPLWQRWVELQSGSYLNIIVGTGFGSASVITNNLDSTLQAAEMLNPHAQIIRLFVENGIAGTLIFILAFLYPITKFELSSQDKHNIILSTLFLLGLCLGHRSSGLFIFYGIFLCLARMSASKQELAPNS